MYVIPYRVFMEITSRNFIRNINKDETSTSKISLINFHNMDNIQNVIY